MEANHSIQIILGFCNISDIFLQRIPTVCAVNSSGNYLKIRQTEQWVLNVFHIRRTEPISNEMYQEFPTFPRNHTVSSRNL